MISSGSLFQRLASLPLWLRFLVFATTLGIVYWVSTWEPSPHEPNEFWALFWQSGHAPLYGLLAAGFLLLHGPTSATRRVAWVGCLVLVATVGYADEWHQMSLAARSSDLRDLGTDLLGGVGAILAVRWFSEDRFPFLRGLVVGLALLAAILSWSVWSLPLDPLPLPFS